MNLQALISHKIFADEVTKSRTALHCLALRIP